MSDVSATSPDVFRRIRRISGHTAFSVSQLSVHLVQMQYMLKPHMAHIMTHHLIDKVVILHPYMERFACASDQFNVGCNPDLVMLSLVQCLCSDLKCKQHNFKLTNHHLYRMAISVILLWTSMKLIKQKSLCNCLHHFIHIFEEDVVYKCYN